MCTADDSSLVIPTNPEENKLIAKYLRAHNIAKTWIGAKISLSYWHGVDGMYAIHGRKVILEYKAEELYYLCSTFPNMSIEHCFDIT